ncbi:serine protease [uncultured Mucilaginibacter sp.]|uniref:S1 family peptidase n=1 Tax=uncultured Mucilaginibacter sp. TaxID=797541 RepID=UPI00261B22E5|nr:serine protease [uncultured Mucilaginibacter sp.]
MIDRTLLDNLTYTTLLSLDQGKSSGSGFLLNFNGLDYLITARHVLFDEDNIRCNTLLVSSQNYGDKNEDARMFELDMLKATVLNSKSEDVAAILFGSLEKGEFEEYISIAQEGKSQTLSIKQDATILLNKIKIANDVYLVGFPTSLIFQNSNHFDPGKPLLRKGIVGGINFEDKNFIIDCSAYYGNSGGPIIELSEENKLVVIGFVSRYIPFVIEWRNNREISVTHAEYLNSGYSVCIPMDAIFKLIN